MNFLPSTDLKLHPNGVPFRHESVKVEGYGAPKQGWDGDLMNDNLLRFYPGKPDGGTNREQDQASSGSRRKGNYLANDRRRRIRISERIVALQRFVPNSKQGGPSITLDEITGYIQNLQLQLEDLSASTLGAKAASGNDLPFFPQRLGLGNHPHGYRPDTMNAILGPVGELMGRLMEERPLLARKLLESKGLFLVPTTVAQELGSLGSCSSSSINNNLL